MKNYESSIPKAKANIQKSMSKGMEELSAFIVEEIRTNLVKQGAKDTGALIDSYSAVQTKDGVEIGSDLDYSAYVEFGTGVYAEDGKGVNTPWAFKGSDGNWYTTKGMRPRPHIRPAFENNIDKIEQMLAEELQEIE